MADNFENIPVDITAEELEERVKKPIDTKATSGSNNFITSGAVYNAVSDKIPLLEVTIRSYSDLDVLFSNSVYNVDKTIFNLIISGIGQIRPIVNASNLRGEISNDTLLMTNIENGEKWIYKNGSSVIERVRVNGNDIEPETITPFQLDRVYVEYEGKYTVSTFSDLNEILNEKEYINVLYAFTFPDDSEIYDKVKGVNFIATYGLFIDTESGKTWVYTNGTFTPKNTIVQNTHISTNTNNLSFLFDKKVDFLNVNIVGAYDNIPYGQYWAFRVEFSQGFLGYLLIGVNNGSIYSYNRDTETFASFGFATKEYVDNKLGDIETLLSQI